MRNKKIVFSYAVVNKKIERTVALGKMAFLIRLCHAFRTDFNSLLVETPYLQFLVLFELMRTKR